MGALEAPLSDRQESKQGAIVILLRVMVFDTGVIVSIRQWAGCMVRAASERACLGVPPP